MSLFKKLPLIVWVVIAICLGIVCSYFMPVGIVRVFMTFNGIFSQFLGFMIPLIILGLVAPAIADLGQGGGKLLLMTVCIAYVDTLLGGLTGYFTGDVILSKILTGDTSALASKDMGLDPYFIIEIAPLMQVMTALILAFVLGLGTNHLHSAHALRTCMDAIKEVVSQVIEKVIIPFLPLYIYGIFLKMGMEGNAGETMLNFLKVFLIILGFTWIFLIAIYTIAGTVAGKNPFKLLWTMLPAYVTALGTSSSAATIPVTLKSAKKNGIEESIADFVIPLCATIHLCGSALKITACAVAIMLMTGMTVSFGTMIGFILMLGVVMVAAPGVPGGAIMACLGVLQSILGFDSELQGMMIALYIAMDSFGTACNVTGDGAIAVLVNKFAKAN